MIKMLANISLAASSGALIIFGVLLLKGKATYDDGMIALIMIICVALVSLIIKARK